MDEDGFENLLNSLQSDGILERLDEVRQTIHLLSAFFDNELTSVEAQLYTGLALDIRNGLFSFLNTVAQVPEIRLLESNPPSTEIFQLLSDIVIKFPQVAEYYAGSIIRWCVSLLVRGTPIRPQAIKLVELILVTCSCINIDLGSCVTDVVEFVSKEKKISPTLMQSIFSLFGCLCCNHPDLVSSYANWFIEKLELTFKESEKSNRPSSSLLEGCFMGLEGYLKNFNFSQGALSTCYNYVKLYCDLKEDSYKKTVNRAALAVFTKHSSVFFESVYKDLNHWNTILTEWLSLSQDEDKHLGTLALTALYNGTAMHITSGNPPDNAKTTFEYLRQELENDLFNDFRYSPYRRKRCAIGIAELAKCYVVYASEDELRQILSNLFARSHSISDYMVSTLSAYLVSIAKIMVIIRANSAQLSNFSRLTVQLIEKYPDVPAAFRKYTMETVETSFCSLFDHTAGNIEKYFHEVIYQSIIRSCAHRLAVDAQLLSDTEKKIVSYKSYRDLWIHLLTMRRRAEGRQNNLLAGAFVYDTYISVFLEIISKLDLNLNTISQEHSDPDLALEAQSPNDYLIFVNLTDLFQEVIPHSDTAQLDKWFSSIIKECIGLSSVHPMVSGFYKIISTCFEVSHITDFFSEESALSQEIISFMEKTMKQVNMRKGDLQISCLTMIFSAPSNLIKPLLYLATDTFIAALRVGRGYPAILKCCLNALDRWQKQLKIEQILPILQEILPAFDSLLQSSNVMNQRSRTVVSMTNKKRRIKNLKITQLADGELTVLQKQFLIFLGKLDPSICSTLLKLPPPSTIVDGPKLRYEIPFPDSLPFLELNSVIPRIMELASTSGDRSTRITACELLHAIILLAIARTRRPENNPTLFKNLISAALLLSCDPDRTVSELFQPLLLQVMHYFSGKLTLGSAETANLIEVLFDGATHSCDLSVRDFSAKCIQEFISWSIKQTSPEELKIAPINIRAMLRMVNTYAVHPDRSKRLGAATVFNNIYSIIREESAILEDYWFELFSVFIRNLELCEAEEDACIVTQAVKRILRPLIEKSHLFVLEGPQRRIPVGFEGGTLKDLIIFTFCKCSSVNRFLRRVAQEAVVDLTFKVPQVESLKGFLLQNGVTPSDVRLLDETIYSFEASLDYVNWLFKEGVINVSELERNVTIVDLFVNKADVSSSLEVLSPLIEYSMIVCRNLSFNMVKYLAQLLFSFSKENFAFEELLSRMVDVFKKDMTTWNSFSDALPVIDQTVLIELLQNDDRTKQVSFIRGFLILDRSHALKKIYSGQQIIVTIFSRLFEERGKRISCIFVEPIIKRQYEKLLEFAFKQGVDAEAFVQIICDTTPVNNNTTKGGYIYNLFQKQIDEHLIGDARYIDVFVSKNKGLSWILIVLNSYCTVSKADFATKCLEQWDTVHSTESTLDLLNFLKCVSDNQTEPFSTFKHRGEISNWLLNALESEAVSMSFDEIKILFELLPQLSLCMEEENTALEKALDSFRSRSKLFYDPTKLRNDDRATIESIYAGIFRSIQLTRSLVAIGFLKNTVNEHLKIVPMESFNTVLSEFAQQCTEFHVKKATDIFYEFLFVNIDRHIVDRDSLFCVQQFLSSLLIHSKYNAMHAFFVSHLNTIANVITDFKTNGKEEIVLLKKIFAVHLLEAFYLKTTQNDRETIIKEASGKSGPDFLRPIFKFCSFDAPLEFAKTRNGQELVRLYHCACVKFKCAFVAQNPKNDEIMYSKFIFTSDGKNSLWHHVIDDNKKYSLRMDFDVIPKRKQIMVSIKKNAADELNKKAKPVVYAHSQTLFESTLKEDVRKFDLTHAAVEKNASILPDGILSVELELDSLNQHEVMASLCGAVNHMVSRGIKPSEGSDPCWLKCLTNVLTSNRYHKNAKLLAFKMLHNLETFVEPYIEKYAPDIFNGLSKTFENEPCNYLLIDILLFLIRSRPKLSSECEVTNILIRLIEKNGSSQKHILRYLFDVAKGMVECWGHLLYEHLLVNLIRRRMDLNGELETYVSLNFFSVLLGNNAFPKDLDPGCVTKWILQIMASEKKNFQLASEVLGMLLNNYKLRDDFVTLRNSVVATLRAMPGGDMDILRIYYVHKFYPEICDDFVCILLNVAWSKGTEMKRRSLEMLYSHISRYDEFEDMDLKISIKKFMVDMLKSKIAVILDTTLKIALHVIAFIDDSVVSDIYEAIVKLSDHSEKEIRLSSTKVLVKMIERFENSSAFATLIKSSRIALLKRLNDTDEDVQNISLNFWAQSTLNNLSSEKRILCILGDLFFSDIEIEYVEYACRLLLQAATLTPHYNQEIEKALTDCEYSDLHLNVSWRAQHSSVTVPMFAPSVACEMSRNSFDRPSKTTAQLLIRATAQSLAFQPTQIETRRSEDWSQEQQKSDPEFKKPKVPYRFSQSQAYTKIVYAKRADELKEKEERERQNREKQKDVRLYRNYRYGDFPDVQIKHSQLLPTVLALAAKDQQIAKELFIGIITSMASTLPDKEKFLSEVTDHIMSMLQTSQCSDILLTSTIFQFALTNSLILDATEVCRAAKGTGLLSLGSLLIEQGIINGMDVASAPKRPKLNYDVNTSNWLKLAQLYQNMGDVDGLRGIFLGELNEPEVAKTAIQHEALLEWSMATKCYEELLTGEISEEKMLFYGQTYFSCLANLSNWQKLRDSIKQSSDVSCLWEDSGWRAFALPWYIRSQMMSSFYEEDDSFKSYMNECSADSSKTYILHEKFTKEASLSYWLNDRLPQAMFFLNKAYIAFLVDWSQVNVWDTQLKKSLLQEALILSEVQTILHMVSSQAMIGELSEQLQLWSRCTPTTDNDLLLWDIRLSIRKCFMSHFGKSESENDCDELKECMLKNHLIMAKSAAEQGNLYLSNTYLKFAKKQSMNFAEQCVWKQARNKCLVLEAIENSTDAETKIKNFSNALQKIDASYSSRMDDDSSEWRQLCAHANVLKLEVISAMLTIAESSNICLNPLLPPNQQNLNKLWMNSALSALNMLDSNVDDIEQKGSVHMKMAKFYSKQGAAFWRNFVLSLFKAMQCGNLESRQMFGSVLTADGAQDTADIEEESQRVPSWMFLLWRQQLLSFLPQENSGFIRSIIRRLCLDYPNAVRYCFRLAKETYDSHLNNSNFVLGLSQQVLNNPLEHTFVTAISQVVCPRYKLKYHIEKIVSSLSNHETISASVSLMVKDLKNLLRNPDNGIMYNTIAEFEIAIDETLKSTEIKDLKSQLLTMIRQLEISKSPLKPLLKAYSLWMSNYCMLGNRDSIEVPGQYSGLWEPKVEKHVRIGAFDPNVVPQTSKTRPFKITIIGDNAKQYNFLVKFGEDLRQDERIQQAFRLIKTQFGAGKMASGELTCYEVVPITSSYGLIQWVENTKSLGQLILSEVGITEMEGARQNHLEMFDRRLTNVIDIYEKGIRTVSEIEAVNSFNRQVKKFPSNILRRQLWCLCRSAEQFVSFRSNFASSLAVLNMAQWIIGVGDRHLENMLVCKNTGRVIGIDFGLAFGLATSAIGIPELVPFRLTPQMVEVMSPLGANGWFKQTMLSSLRILRENPAALLAVLEVFIREPSLNWQEHANRAHLQGEFEDTNWYPRQKIDIVTNKLAGGNPVACFEVDLKLGHGNKASFPHYLNILKGKSGNNIRASCPPSALSIHQQVDCLIDLATDPLVLAFTYVGWNPWL